jgi:hypothetical protein
MQFLKRLATIDRSAPPEGGVNSSARSAPEAPVDVAALNPDSNAVGIGSRNCPEMAGKGEKRSGAVMN